MDIYYNHYVTNKENGNQVTYVVNDLDMTDLIIIIGFSFMYLSVIWFTRKVVNL